ncbi:MAG: cupredoxin domain-containing protein [Tumebacillaceae bacterium]
MKKSISLLLLALGLLAPQTASAETQSYLTSSHVSSMAKGQEFWIVTNEIKTKVQEGQIEREIEAYRWEPGFLVVDKDKPVTLHFYGLKGKAHPFEIEGLGVRGNVEKGKVTTLTFTPKQAGTFKIVCLAHPTIDKNGPMIGYLRVE